MTITDTLEAAMLRNLEQIPTSLAEAKRAVTDAVEQIQQINNRINAMPPSLARRVLEVADEIARLASKQASDLKPFEIGNALERLRQLRAEVEADDRSQDPLGEALNSGDGSYRP